VRIRVLSDLHNEFRSFMPPEIVADVTVLAGDIDIGKRGVGWAATVFGGRPVIYVAGNHEYYGRAIPKLTGDLVELGESVGVTVLESASANVAGIRFLGCTLWSDFEIAGSSAASMAACSEVMTDFRRIRVSPSFRRLRPADQRGLHQASVRWLRSELRAGDATRTVVVTHHAPSARSLDVGSRTDPQPELLAGREPFNSLPNAPLACLRSLRRLNPDHEVTPVPGRECLKECPGPGRGLECLAVAAGSSGIFGFGG